MWRRWSNVFKIEESALTSSAGVSSMVTHSYQAESSILYSQKQSIAHPHSLQHCVPAGVQITIHLEVQDFSTAVTTLTNISQHLIYRFIVQYRTVQIILSSQHLTQYQVLESRQSESVSQTLSMGIQDCSQHSGERGRRRASLSQPELHYEILPQKSKGSMLD